MLYCEQARRFDPAMFKKSNRLERRLASGPRAEQHASCISAPGGFHDAPPSPGSPVDISILDRVRPTRQAMIFRRPWCLEAVRESQFQVFAVELADRDRASRGPAGAHNAAR